jgi:hypothetical protein
MKLLKFTRPDGEHVWIVPTWITHVTLPSGGPGTEGHNTRIHLSDGIQDVAEALEEVVHDLRDALL